MMGLLCFGDASPLQNDRDNPLEGIQGTSQGRLRRRAPESPAQDAAKTRLEDNYGKPLDALYLSPPVGTRSCGASNAGGTAHETRAKVRAEFVAESGKWRMRIPGVEVPHLRAVVGRVEVEAKRQHPAFAWSGGGANQPGCEAESSA